MASPNLNPLTTDGYNFGQSATDKIGFYGLATPIAQQSAAALATVATVSMTIGGFGFSTSAQYAVIADQLRAITSALKSLNIITTV